MLRRRNHDQQAGDNFAQWQKNRKRANPRLGKKCEWGQRNRKLRTARGFDQTRIKEDASRGSREVPGRFASRREEPMDRDDYPPGHLDIMNAEQAGTAQHARNDASCGRRDRDRSDLLSPERPR